MSEDDEVNYGGPSHLTMPDGTAEEHLAWLQARLQEGLDSGPAREIDIDIFFEDIKRRGRERLARKQRAA